MKHLFQGKYTQMLGTHMWRHVFLSR